MLLVCLSCLQTVAYYSSPSLSSTRTKRKYILVHPLLVYSLAVFLLSQKPSRIARQLPIFDCLFRQQYLTRRQRLPIHTRHLASARSVLLHTSSDQAH